MKLLFSLFCSFCALTLSAAQLTWGAGYLSSTFNNGTAYLIQCTTDLAPTISQIADYVEESGISYTGDNYSFNLMDQVNVTGSGEYYYVPQGVLAGDDGIEAKTYSNCFVIVISNDGKSYAIYDGYQDIIVDPDKPTEANFGDWAKPPMDGWLTGTIGPVPEPYSLGLLSLGIACVALRRRKGQV